MPYADPPVGTHPRRWSGSVAGSSVSLSPLCPPLFSSSPRSRPHGGTGETGTAARHRRCFSPSPPVPSSSSPELLLPPLLPSSSTSLLQRRYVSSPRPLLPVVDRPPARITSSTSRCSDDGCHSSPSLPPRVDSSHLRERRESTPIYRLPGGECDDALRHPRSTGSPYSTT
jgi:hypothetical protein